jgi:hypothetical protein
LNFIEDEEFSFDSFLILSDTVAIEGSFSYDEVDDDDFDETCLQLSFNDAYEDIEDNDNNSDEDDSTSESTCLFWDTVVVVTVVRGSTISIIALKLLFELMLRDFFKGIVKY